MPSVGACSPPGHSASRRSSSSRATAAVTGSPSTSTGSRPAPGAPAAADSSVSSEATTSRCALTAGRSAPDGSTRSCSTHAAQLTDRPLVAGRLQRPGVRVDLRAHLGRLRQRHRGPQLAHAVAEAAHRDVRVALRLLPAPVGGGRVGLDQLSAHQRPQPGDRQPGGLRQHHRLDRGQHVVRGLARPASPVRRRSPAPSASPASRPPALPRSPAAAAAASSTAPRAASPPSVSSSGPAPARRGRTPTRPRRAAAPPTPPTPPPSAPAAGPPLAGRSAASPTTSSALKAASTASASSTRCSCAAFCSGVIDAHRQQIPQPGRPRHHPRRQHDVVPRRGTQLGDRHADTERLRREHARTVGAGYDNSGPDQRRPEATLGDGSPVGRRRRTDRFRTAAQWQRATSE